MVEINSYSRIDLRYIFEALISMPKSIYFNFACLPFRQAIKIPFYVNYKTQLHTKRSVIKFGNEVSLHPFMIKFGNRGSEGIMAHNSNCIWLDGGSVTFNGSAAFGIGSSIRVSGDLIFGKSFCANRNTFIACSKSVRFGDDVLLGWNVSVRDSDGHTLIYGGGNQQPTVSPVSIGNNVWICAECHILKGSKLGDNCVLGYKSLLTGGTSDSNVLWAGHPAKPIRNGITWNSIPWDEHK